MYLFDVNSLIIKKKRRCFGAKTKIHLIWIQPYLPVSGRVGNGGFRAASPGNLHPPHGPDHGRGGSASYAECALDELVGRTTAVARALK
jgi:hypothetical protein